MHKKDQNLFCSSSRVWKTLTRCSIIVDSCQAQYLWESVDCPKCIVIRKGVKNYWTQSKAKLSGYSLFMGN